MKTLKADLIAGMIALLAVGGSWLYVAATSVA